MGTLIRHAFCAVATAVSLLPVAVIQSPLAAALMATVGGTALPQARLLTTLRAAVALSPVATGADREQRPASRITAKSRSEYNFRMNRHRSARAAFDKDNSSWHRRTISVVPFRHEGCQSEPRCANSGVLLSAPRKIQHDFPDRPDDRRMIAPAARMISSCPIPATVQIYTLPDDRRHPLVSAPNWRNRAQ